MTGRRDGLVVAHADHRDHQAVGAGHLEQLVVVGQARSEGGQLHGLALADVVGDGAVDQLVEVGDADRRKHLGDVLGVGPMWRLWKARRSRRSSNRGLARLLSVIVVRIYPEGSACPIRAAIRRGRRGRSGRAFRTGRRSRARRGRTPAGGLGRVVVGESGHRVDHSVLAQAPDLAHLVGPGLLDQFLALPHAVAPVGLDAVARPDGDEVGGQRLDIDGDGSAGGLGERDVATRTAGGCR